MEILLLCLLSCVGIIISFQFTALSYVPNIPMAAATATTTAANQSSSAISNRTHTVITAQGLANPSTTTNNPQGLANPGVNCTPNTNQASLTITKLVLNPNQLNTVPALNTLQFGITVTNNGAVVPSGSSFALMQSQSIRLCINPGRFTVIETSEPGGFVFTTTFSSSGITPISTTGSSCFSANILAGQSATCTITNTLVSGTTASTIIPPPLVNPSSVGTSAGQAIISAQGKSLCTRGLPCGLWTVIVNGLQGELLIRSVDNQGKINASLFGHVISNSTWDPISKKITFTDTVVMGSNNSISYQYTGFYHNICGIDRGSSLSAFCYILAGSAVPKRPPTQEAARQEFGWIALYRY